MTELQPFRADYHPVLGQLMKEMGLSEVINDVVNVEDSQAKIDIGTFTCLILHNLLGDVNIRFFMMQSFFEDKALPLLVPWKPDINLAEINDDRAARVLDAIWKADPQKVFARVANRAIQIHELDTHIIHGDTTSKSFTGAFMDQNEEGRVPFITHGYNKDHRPDLKQLVFGVGTTADGIPVIGEISDGNDSDMTLNGRWIKSLRKILNKQEEDLLLYVADSALVTSNNLLLLDKYNIDFISRLPGRFGIEEKLKQQAYHKDNWDFIGKLSIEKKAALYHTCEIIEQINNNTYRFVIIKSDQKDKRKLKALDSKVKQERTKIMKILKKLGKRQFICEQDAKIEAEKFIKTHNILFHEITWLIDKKVERVKRNKRGRPKKDEIIPTQTSYYLRCELNINETYYEKNRELCGLFVIITSLMDIEKYPAKVILERYKGQGNVERIFKFIKNPSWIGSFCLKKPERLAALGYLLLIAGMVYTLWERRVRLALRNKNISPIEGLNRKKTRIPTAYALQKALSSILVLAQKVENNVQIWLPKPLKPNQRRIIELSGFTVDIYMFDSTMI